MGGVVRLRAVASSAKWAGNFPQLAPTHPSTPLPHAHIFYLLVFVFVFVYFCVCICIYIHLETVGTYTPVHSSSSCSDIVFACICKFVNTFTYLQKKIVLVLIRICLENFLLWHLHPLSPPYHA